MTKLSGSQIESSLTDIPEWSEAGGAIQRTYKFRDFTQAMAFVNRVAEVAQRMDHHPDILIRYNKVTLTLSTHDAGGVTQKDFDLAAEAEAAAVA